jgi:hypothetical protein
MPIEMDVSTLEKIDIEEFRRRVLEKVDPCQPLTLVNASSDLVALSNDPNLLLDRIARDIGSWREPKFSMYSAQSCLLERFGPFSVRINIWPAQVSTQAEREALSYNAYHDHNFSFITTNLYGPGYTTDIYEYALRRRPASVGDAVELTKVGEKQLLPGKVFCYLKSADMHAQMPPVEQSASLNLILTDDDVLNDDQYYFDVVRSRISGMVENVASKRISVIDFGRFLGSKEASGTLASVAVSSQCFRTRTKAKEILNFYASSDVVG